MIHHLEGESQFSEESEEEEQTPMIVAEDDKDFTSKLPNEDLLEKNVQQNSNQKEAFARKS